MKKAKDQTKRRKVRCQDRIDLRNAGQPKEEYQGHSTKPLDVSTMLDLAGRVWMDLCENIFFRRHLGRGDGGGSICLADMAVFEFGLHDRPRLIDVVGCEERREIRCKRNGKGKKKTTKNKVKPAPAFRGRRGLNEGWVECGRLGKARRRPSDGDKISKLEKRAEVGGLSQYISAWTAR